MSTEAFDWLVLFVMLLFGLATCALLAAIVEWFENRE